MQCTSSFTDCHTEGQNILFTDGEYVNQIAASRDVSVTYSGQTIFTSHLTPLFHKMCTISFLFNIWLFLG